MRYSPFSMYLNAEESCPWLSALGPEGFCVSPQARQAGQPCSGRVGGSKKQEDLDPLPEPPLPPEFKRAGTRSAMYSAWGLHPALT